MSWDPRIGKTGGWGVDWHVSNPGVEGPEKLLAGQSPGGMVPFYRASSHLETTEKQENECMLRGCLVFKCCSAISTVELLRALRTSWRNLCVECGGEKSGRTIPNPPQVFSTGHHNILPPPPARMDSSPAGEALPGYFWERGGKRGSAQIPHIWRRGGCLGRDFSESPN